MTQTTVNLNAEELERRVHTHLPKLIHRKAKARFINASLALGRLGTITSLEDLGDLVGIGTRTTRDANIGYATCGRLEKQLIAAGIAAPDVERADVFVEKLECSLRNHRHVIHLHDDLRK